ncbi:hypothetical protein J6590_046827 [Homalodisca vitripennis]|nr:hypothetical protein J6590_046827 [Homalodisca vitripennis]
MASKVGRWVFDSLLKDMTALPSAVIPTLYESVSKREPRMIQKVTVRTHPVIDD